LRYDGKLIHGSVSNEPVDVKGMKSNDRATVAPSAMPLDVRGEWPTGRGIYHPLAIRPRLVGGEGTYRKLQSPFRVGDAIRQDRESTYDQPQHPAFRADHVGSYPASRNCWRRASIQAGAISKEQLRAIEDAAIRDIVRFQRISGSGHH
jgi:hypothetical protein